MGEQQTAQLDGAAVRAVADQFDSAAEHLDRVARTPLGFDGASAGRAHTAGGDGLRRELLHVTNDLSAWARAAAEIAAGLRAGVERYRDADQYAASRIS
ncbi:ESX-1 secretion-associated protein [soil metagenome]